YYRARGITLQVFSGEFSLRCSSLAKFWSFSAHVPPHLRTRTTRLRWHATRFGLPAPASLACALSRVWFLPVARPIRRHPTRTRRNWGIRRPSPSLESCKNGASSRYPHTLDTLALQLAEPQGVVFSASGL